MTQRPSKEVSANTQPKRRAKSPSHPRISLSRIPGYLSVRETAHLLGVSERTIYGYIETGRLAASRIGCLTVVDSEAACTFQRQAPGRKRTRTPVWHIPPESNLLSLTYITVRQRPGQGERLAEKLQEMRSRKLHLLPGSAARYIARNQQDPEEMYIVLFWRAAQHTPEEQLAQALADMEADLADLLDWEHAQIQEKQVLVHA